MAKIDLFKKKHSYSIGNFAKKKQQFKKCKYVNTYERDSLMIDHKLKKKERKKERTNERKKEW